jgi:3-hydroxybutyryl-CoA dehydrogenase
VTIEKIAIVGAGTMGRGVAQVALVTGLTVALTDVSSDAVTEAQRHVTRALDRLVERERLGADDRDAAMSRFSTGASLAGVENADLVIEAASENPQIKLKIFAELHEAAREDAILASNTSSISLTEIAASSGRSDKVIGMHFFNPAPVMALVEIIRALQTSDETYQSVFELTGRMGKTPVTVKDSPGFVVNRMLVPMINEAVFVLAEGVASADDIDAAMRSGANHPMGPLALADLIGLDICLSVMEVLFNEFADSKYRPCPLLKKMVDAGYLGRKSGRGFFSYA